MANPQREDGHIDIANEIAEAFAKNFPGHGEAQVLWAILRKTYGWHKKSDLISISQIQQLTGLSRSRIIECLQNLEAKNMIVVKREEITV
jgi:phage replication O-like protein O